MKKGSFALFLSLILLFSLFALADDNSLVPPPTSQLPQDINQPQNYYQPSQPNNNQTQQQYNNQPQQPNYNQPQNNSPQPYNNQPQNNLQLPLQSNNQNQQQYNNPQQNGNSQEGMMQPQNNFGMPSSSSADPEYVAQQKIVEGMTTAYNWISINTTHFSDGCKTDKDALVTEISGVVSNSQETSSVCSRFNSDAQSCNPELFCSTMNSGQLPLPPMTRSTLKKLGYNPDTMKAKDLTLDLIVKVCIEQNNASLASQAEMVAATKKSIQDQLPKFRTACEEYNKNANYAQNLQLPTLNFPSREYAPGTGPNQPAQRQGQIPQQQNQNPLQGQNIVNNLPQGQGCQEPHPDCGANGPPSCNNGNWVCPSTNNPQEPGPNEPTQPPEQNPPADVTQEPVAPEGDAGGNTPSGDGAAGAGESNVVQTMVIIAMNNPVTGLFSALFEGQSAVCGNGMCEPSLGENQQNCSQDCMANQDTQGPNSSPQQMGSNQSSQSRGMGSSMSPQQLCTMTDDEIVAEYMGNVESNLAFDKQRNEYRCSQESTNTLDQINQFSMQSAQCLASAALDCEAKKQAAANCNEMKDSPNTIATMIVNNMCLRFIGSDATKNNKLLGLAAQVNNADPALASQLSDTSEKNLADQKNLNFASYLFGDGNYAQKIKDRTDKLITARDKLTAKGNADDKEVLDILDSQIADLKAESAKFSNAFDLSRLGYLFGR